MKYLLNNEYGPTTFSWGFIDFPFQDTTDAFLSWSNSVFRNYNIDYDVLERNGSFTNLLQELFPVVSPRNRETMMQTASTWTAYFDNAAHGGDPISAVGHMCSLLKCRGVAVTCAPHLPLAGDRGVLGGVQFQLFAPHRTHFINNLRTVSVINDGYRWIFSATGPVQPFEETAQYGAHRIVDRLTPEMLERYCAALGIDLFNPDFYGPRAVFVVNKSPLRPGYPCLSREEARKKLGLD